MTLMDCAIKASIPIGRWLTREEISHIVTPKMPKAVQAFDVMYRVSRLASAGELRSETYKSKRLFLREK